MSTINLTFSEILYIFADTRIPSRSRLVNYDTHPSGEKISVKPMSEEMTIWAICYLLKEGYISLEVRDEKKLFFIPTKTLYTKKLKSPSKSLTGIEHKFFENIQETMKVQTAVYNLLSNDESSPWGQVINISKNSLVQKGILKIEEKAKLFSSKKYLFSDTKTSDYKNEFIEAHTYVDRFSKENQTYELLNNVVKKGIAARKEVSTSDD